MPRLGPTLAERELREKIHADRLHLLRAVDVGRIIGVVKYNSILSWLRANGIPRYKIPHGYGYAEEDIAAALARVQEKTW